MGNDVNSILLSMLSKVLFGYEYSIPSDIDVERVLEESIEQGIFLLVYSELQKENVCLEKWGKKYNNSLVNNIRVLHEHNELGQMLGDISYVTIKGAQSAFYYPIPLLRMMGDVDFLVAKQDLQRVRNLLEEEEFHWNEDEEHGAHMAFHRKPCSVWEMHWTISGVPSGISGDALRNVLSGILDNPHEIVVDGVACLGVSDFYHCLVLLTHTANHMIKTGVGLRHICDWAVFANQVDVSQWEQKLRECGLWRFAQILTQLSTEYLHLPEQNWAMEQVKPEILEDLIKDVFAAGNFGRKDSDRINQAKLFTDNQHGGVDDTPMAVRLFREINDRGMRVMPISKRIVLLRPFAWGFVITRHLARIKKGTRPELDGKDTIKGAKDRRRLYKEFELFK